MEYATKEEAKEAFKALLGDVGCTPITSWDEVGRAALLLLRCQLLPGSARMHACMLLYQPGPMWPGRRAAATMPLYSQAPCTDMHSVSCAAATWQ